MERLGLEKICERDQLRDSGLVQQFIRQLLSNSPVAALAQREDQGEICDHSSA